MGIGEDRNWAVLPMRLGCKGGVVRVRYCRESVQSEMRDRVSDVTW